MGTRLRLTLLMLTALFGVVNPPGRSPGFKPPKSARMIPCEYSNCLGMGAWQSKYRYRCDEHGHTFYYCYIDQLYLTQQQAAGHRHETV